IASELRAVVRSRRLQRARLPQRQREMDDLIAKLRADVERRWQRLVLRHREGRAVGKHAARAAQSELADREQVALDLELGEAPRMRAQRCGAAFDPALEMPLLLLEMLRPEEEPLGPDDAI